MSQPLRLVVFGTGPFAVPTFQALYETPHHVLALVTQPARAVRGREPPVNPMRCVAEQHGTPVIAPESINTDDARTELTILRPDLFVVADYGQILSPETLDVAPLGGINLHGSLLPKYRGAAPINWAIYHGEPETGVTVLHVTPRVDAGPCLAQARTPIDPEETAVELEARLANLGAPLVCQTIGDLTAGRVAAIPQDPSAATRARRLRKTDGEVDWNRSALAIKNQIRAFEPWPKTNTFWHRSEGGPLRLILGRAVVRPDSRSQEVPGTVLAVESEWLIATGDGALVLKEVQPAGKRMLMAADFLRGHPVAVGDRLGPEAIDTFEA